MGPLEIFVIIAVIALLFGAKKIPDIMKGMGQGIKEFKKEVKDPVSPDPVAFNPVAFNPVTPTQHSVVDVPSQQLEPIKLDAVTGQPVGRESAIQTQPTERR